MLPIMEGCDDWSWMLHSGTFSYVAYGPWIPTQAHNEDKILVRRQVTFVGFYEESTSHQSMLDIMQ